MNRWKNLKPVFFIHITVFPVVFEKGEGCYLYDSEGKEYLDFAAGIAVNALGYHLSGL